MDVLVFRDGMDSQEVRVEVGSCSGSRPLALTPEEVTSIREVVLGAVERDLRESGEG